MTSLRKIFDDGVDFGAGKKRNVQIRRNGGTCSSTFLQRLQARPADLLDKQRWRILFVAVTVQVLQAARISKDSSALLALRRREQRRAINATQIPNWLTDAPVTSKCQQLDKRGASRKSASVDSRPNRTGTNTQITDAWEIRQTASRRSPDPRLIESLNRARAEIIAHP